MSFVSFVSFVVVTFVSFVVVTFVSFVVERKSTLSGGYFFLSRWGAFPLVNRG